MADLTAEDVAEMRAQGDFRAFLRTISGKAPRPASPRPKPDPAPAPERDPNHRPGAWPAGTSRPAPNTTSVADWMPALAEYRAWNLAGRPPGNYLCGCGTCPADGGAP